MGGRIQHGVVKYNSCSPRFTVPETEVEEAAIITATWSEEFSSTPVWMFVRHGRLPDGNSFDKS